MLRNIERIVLDECLPLTPDVAEEIERRIGHRAAEIVVLADKYASLPDMIILERLMDARSMLVTQDRPLHNLAIDRGFASLLRTPEAGWTRDRVGPMTRKASLPSCAPSSPEDNLLPPLSSGAAVIVELLNEFRSEKASKQLRTKRRRIRSHFGTPANIGAVALTVAQRRTERGVVGGYKLKVDSRYGTTGLFPASEGYFLDSAGSEHPLMATSWALGQLYGLRLHDRALTVYHLDAAAGERCTALTAHPSRAVDAIEQMTVRLLSEIARVTFLPCKKGQFFEQMTRKLAEIAQWRGNELVNIDLRAVATSLACALP
jgi:hypothetical protein